MSLLFFFKFVSEDLIYGINIYAIKYRKVDLQNSLRKFIGSQEIVTGLIDLFSGIFLLYLYYMMGQIEMIALGAAANDPLVPKFGTISSINMETVD